MGAERRRALQAYYPPIDQLPDQDRAATPFCPLLLLVRIASRIWIIQRFIELAKADRT